MKIAFIGATQLFATIGIALARDDPPPSPVRPWAPPTLPRYEGELRQYQPTEAERRYLPAIDPRKTYSHRSASQNYNRSSKTKLSA